MKILALSVCCLFPLILHAADESSKPGQWAGEGELGFISTSGNSDSETLTANLGVSRKTNIWGHAASLKIIQAETDDVESADSLELLGRSEYTLGDKSYLFGQLRYEDDEFSGFDYQTSLSLGIGSRVIDEKGQFLDLSTGLGVRRLKESATNETEEDAIVSAKLVYEKNLSETTTFNQLLSLETGRENTHTESETSVKFAIDGNLSARIAYLVKRNSEVPADTEKSDRITTISLLYGF